MREKRGRTALSLGAVVLCLLVFAAPALAAAKPKPKASSGAAVLARLTIRTPNVDIKTKKKTSYSKGSSGQVLHQGDTLNTDATAGLAEISYTDGSYTRLGPNTEFSITKLSEKQGVRQTQGTLTVGSTWNRAAKVAETGSFEVKAGGATAAVEGTLFSVVCTVTAGQTSCQWIDLFDPVGVTLNGVTVQLDSATKLSLDQGQLGVPQALTREDLLANFWVSGNIFLDGVLDFGTTSDLPPAANETPSPPPPPPPPVVNGGGEPVVSAAEIVAPGQYPPNGTIVVDNPNVEVGGEESFRGTGCRPGDRLRALRRGAGGHVAHRQPRQLRGQHHDPAGYDAGTAPLDRAGLCVRAQRGGQRSRSPSGRARVHRCVEPHDDVRLGRRGRGRDGERVLGGLASSAFHRECEHGRHESRHAMSDVVDLEHRIGLLREVWLFSGCNEEEIERIAAMAEPRSVDAGTEVTREGDEGLEFFVVVEGEAIASVDGDEIGRIGAGGFFGEMALIDGGERVATVTAAAPMSLLVLGRHEFNEMLEIAMPAVTPKLLAVVGARMRTIDRHAGVESTLGL